MFSYRLFHKKRPDRKYFDCGPEEKKQNTLYIPVKSWCYEEFREHLFLNREMEIFDVSKKSPERSLKARGLIFWIYENRDTLYFTTI